MISSKSIVFAVMYLTHKSILLIYGVIRNAREISEASGASRKSFFFTHPLLSFFVLDLDP